MKFRDLRFYRTKLSLGVLVSGYASIYHLIPPKHLRDEAESLLTDRVRSLILKSFNQGTNDNKA